MRVEVRYMGLIRERVGKTGEVVNLREGTPLSKLLDRLVKRYGEPLRELLDTETENLLDPSYVITVNGVSHKQDTKLGEGDRVALMTIISGG